MAQVFHGDCLEVMKTLPDKSIDLFVCDLPYGCLEPQRTRDPEYVKKVKNSGVGQGSCRWDIAIDLDAFWREVKRLCRDDHTPVLMFCNTRFGYDLIKSNESWFRYDLVWNKSRGVSFLQANKMPLRSHELIYVFAKKGARYYRTDIEGDFPAYVGSHSADNVYNLPKKVDNGKRCVKSVISINNESNKGGKHPTQKPRDLYAWLITRYSKEGDTILDPTAGSFASVHTAARLGRNAIGIEKDDTFFQRFSSCGEPK